ncbi:EndoU domain-containing protein [Listeria monocytogenes]|nr:EndoU domain-containing protein [Listeria monocytogenes]
MVGGGTLTGVGVGLDATGVGAVAGVPASIAGIAIATGSAALASSSGANFVQDAKDLFSNIKKGKDKAKEEATEANDFEFGSNSKKHLENVETVNTKKGVVGGHNMDEFNKALKNQGFNPEDLIVSKKSHPTIEGIYEIKYKIPRKDMTGKVAKPVSYKEIKDPKTVYDPTKISNEKMFEWGQSAMNNGKIQPDGRTVIGTSSNGLKFIGYLDEVGKVTNFYPVLN